MTKFRVWETITQTQYVNIDAIDQDDAILKSEDAFLTGEPIETASSHQVWVEKLDEVAVDR